MVAAMMFQRRQEKFNGTEKLDTIDVDSVQLKKRKQEKFWIKELNLLEQDREILLNPAGELTDSIIDAAQTLLKQAFPQLCGLQSVSCGLTMTFDIEPSEFVQVLNNGITIG